MSLQAGRAGVRDGEPGLQHRGHLEAELQESRSELLSWVLVLSFGVAWAWLAYVVSARRPIGWEQVPVVLLPLAAWAALRLRERHYQMAAWVMMGGQAGSLLAVLHMRPGSLGVACAGLWVLLAAALLDTGQALLATLLLWGVGLVAGAWWPGMGGPSATSGSGPAAAQSLGLPSLGLLLAAWGLSWLVMRPLRTAVGLFLQSWRRADEALRESRDRRGEVYRVMRALEEATYRIERMNQELVVARREAELARAAKARFTAMVSHELRGPLNLVLGYSRLMALSPEVYGQPLPDPYRADVDTIYRSSAHLVGLVDDILDLSQIEADRLPLVKDRVLLPDDVLDKALAVVQPLAERKGLALQRVYQADLPWILADPVRLRQALLNLLVNAIRHTENGTITVRTERREQYLLIGVEDTGEGIAPEDMPRLFEQFSQIGPGAARTMRGTGLGLNITKQLVELHGGQIWAESEHGVGTRVWFTLPLPGARTEVSPSLQVTEGSVAEAPLPGGQPVCLALHHDIGAIRALARHLAGYRVVGLPEARDLVSLVQDLHPRAVLTTGERLVACQEAFAAARLDVPIISCALPDATGTLRARGIVSYLTKPISQEALLHAMRHVERGGETTVLVVDDEPDAVRLVETLLTTLPRPYRILRAYDGDEALAVMAKDIPDVVIIDLVMPRLDGEGTITRMRADERTRDVPVVVISGRDQPEAAKALDLPISIHRRRPLEVVQAARVLAALLDAVRPDYLQAPANG